MADEELKNAIKTKRPVMLKVILLGWIYYECVSGILADGEDITAILKDRCGHSVTYAAPKMLRYATKEEIAEANRPIWERSRWYSVRCKGL